MPVNGMLRPSFLDEQRRQNSLTMPPRPIVNNMNIKGLPDVSSPYRFAIVNVQLGVRNPGELPAIFLLCQSVLNFGGPSVVIIDYLNDQPDFISLAKMLLHKASTDLHFDKVFAINCYLDLYETYNQAANETAELMKLSNWYAPELMPIEGFLPSFEMQPFGQRQLLLPGPMARNRLGYDEDFAETQKCSFLSKNLAVNQTASDGTPIGCVTADSLLAAYQIAEVMRRDHGIGVTYDN